MTTSTDANTHSVKPGRQVQIIAFEAQTNRRETISTCRINAAGKVEISGDPQMAARLANGIHSPAAGRTVTPDDGGLFLDAVLAEFRNVYLFAEESNA